MEKKKENREKNKGNREKNKEIKFQNYFCIKTRFKESIQTLVVSIHFKNTSCGAACYARGLLSYNIEFQNAISYTFINNNTKENMRTLMCCKCVKVVSAENV